MSQWRGDRVRRRTLVPIRASNGRKSITRRNSRRRGACLAQLIIGALAGALVPTLLAADTGGRNLSFEDRVAAQGAIEQVYWNHRIWPKENKGPKPALSSLMPDSTIWGKVEDYLRKSNALEKWWNRPITAEQLQAELDRMAARSRDPRILGELFAALGNDPYLIAETLARPALVERLAQTWYANDSRFHGTLKKKVEEELENCASVSCMRSMGGKYRETIWKLRTEGPAETPDSDPEAAKERPRLRRDFAGDAISLDADEWHEHLARLSKKLGGTPESLPLQELSRLEETDEGFSVTAVLSQREGEVTTATAVWPKLPFDRWWARQQETLSTRVEDSSVGFILPATSSPGCDVDTWSPTYAKLLDSRLYNTTVWTGTEMIVWGGSTTGLATGDRYNPSTDTWTPTSTGLNVPAPRSFHTAVWTGTEMIVWGGSFGPYLNTGGRYNPSTDTWAPTSTGSNVPSGRAQHTAVWTGTEMIVWGGDDDIAALNTGGRYNPSTDTWAPTSTGTNVPEGRVNHTAVWTGTEMIVWGGFDITDLDTGGRYNPSNDTWTPTSTGTNLPAAREVHTAVWTGTEMIVWGGYGPVAAADLNTGGRYNPSTDTWAPTSTGASVPEGRQNHTAVWTGTEMIVWGGYDFLGVGDLNSGGRYNPSTDTWTPTSTGTNVPTARHSHSAVWTGTEMIIWGGGGIPGNTGGRYNPSSDSWVPTAPDTPPARAEHTAVWTGTEMIVWGGFDGGSRYDPSTDTWSSVSIGANVPTGRVGHTAVWTGTEMIVWGGWRGTNNTAVNTGGRYNPSTDTWVATSTGANVPSPRNDHTAVWTGTKMIVWGGSDEVFDFNSGGRYDPSTDTWATTSMGANVPSERFEHTAVWTGTEMIVWGNGDSLNLLNTGGRYNPSTDTWAATATGANVPSARERNTTVWTGIEMIVWGGTDASFHDVNTGGRYNPSTDTWTATSTGANVPSPTSGRTAVWTGQEMIIWGGYGTGGSTGGRYDPSIDTWAPTSTGANDPSYRNSYTAVWTGTEMIVWGGSGTGGSLNSGSLYCACPSGTLYYRDVDADGYGDPAVAWPSCSGTIPAGYAANSTDCNDASASVHPAAAEVCNGIDDNCDGILDNATPPGGAISLAMSASPSALAWAPLATAQSYDAVYGDLVLLRSSLGNFTTATQGCLANDTASTSLAVGLSPGLQQGYWFLVRGNNCGGAGTYDSGDPRQIGLRDAEIAASPSACP